MEFHRPLVTVDTIVLSLVDHRLQVLLVQRDQAPALGVWALPGGFVHTEEDHTAEDAARRVLSTKAGLEVRHMEQLSTFAGDSRDSRGWSVSIAYLALVQDNGLIPSGRARFFPVEEVTQLPFDHNEILQTALHRVRDKASYSSLPAFLLPEAFTLPELQKVYEEVLGTDLNAAAFRRKVIDQELVEEVAETENPVSRKAGRPAQHYRLSQSHLQDMGRVVMLPDRRRGGPTGM